MPDHEQTRDDKQHVERGAQYATKDRGSNGLGDFHARAADEHDG